MKKTYIIILLFGICFLMLLTLVHITPMTTTGESSLISPISTQADASDCYFQLDHPYSINGETPITDADCEWPATYSIDITPMTTTNEIQTMDVIFNVSSLSISEEDLTICMLHLEMRSETIARDYVDYSRFSVEVYNESASDFQEVFELTHDDPIPRELGDVVVNFTTEIPDLISLGQVTVHLTFELQLTEMPPFADYNFDLF